MNDIPLIKQLFKTVVRTNSSLVGISFGFVGAFGKNARNLNIGAIDFLQTFEMKLRGKAGADNSCTNGLFLHSNFNPSNQTAKHNRQIFRVLRSAA